MAFPEETKTFLRAKDPTEARNLTEMATYRQKLKDGLDAGDTREAEDYLNHEMTDGPAMNINASRFNEVINEITDIENFYKKDVKPYIDTKTLAASDIGSFSRFITYHAGNIVAQDGRYYECIQKAFDIPVTNTSYWRLFLEPQPAKQYIISRTEPQGLVTGDLWFYELPNYNDVFGNNSWEIIKAVCQTGDIPASWAVGDTKELLGKDGNTYHIRLSDKQAGRYTYSNDSTRTTNAVFEFVELPNIQTQYNKTESNVGGFANSQLRKNLNGLTGVQSGKNFLTTIIPDDLAGLLEEVNITTATTGASWDSSKVSTSANKLFVPTYINVKTTTEPQYLAEGSLWDYYASHTSNADRRKALVTNLTSYQEYWTASPIASYSNIAGSVHSVGYMSEDVANSSYYASPCFAF